MYEALSYTITGGRARHQKGSAKTSRILSRYHGNNDDLVPKLAFITTGLTAILSFLSILFNHACHTDHNDCIYAQTVDLKMEAG